MKITTEQIGELIKQSRGGNPRVNRENLQAYLRNPNAFLQSGLYPVTVDYGKTIEEMVSAGNYDRRNGSINSKNFPIKGKGKTSVNLEPVHLNKVVSSENVLAYLDENGMRPAVVEELLAFGATYPEIQREFPIICLGSSWVDSLGDRSVPCLDRYGSDRRLGLDWFDDGWGGCWRFLAVRK